MAPEYGATCGFFPVDHDTVKYLSNTGRDADRVALVEAYAKAQGYWRPDQAEPVFTDTLELDHGAVVPSISGPKRPQDRVLLSEGDIAFADAMSKEFGKASDAASRCRGRRRLHGHPWRRVHRRHHVLHQHVQPVRADRRRPRGQQGARAGPDAQALGQDLARARIAGRHRLSRQGRPADDLDALGFNLVGYGCTTCIGNSGPLDPPLAKAIADGDLVSCSVLSGNRNFEGRIGPDIKANYLASPPLVVAYAIAGTLRKNLTKDPIGSDKDGNDVYLKDIWPTSHEIAEIMPKAVTPEMFAERYSDVFKGDEHWQGIEVSGGQTYSWPPASTYVQNPPYFEGMALDLDAADGREGRPRARRVRRLDHHRPHFPGRFDQGVQPGRRYLQEHQVVGLDFNSYGSRRGNHEVMMRGTFANIRIKNQMVPGVEGGVTVHYPDGEQMAIYDAAMKYEAEGTPLVIFAGDLYGNGSSRDWAAKGTILLGVRAVIAAASSGSTAPT